MASYAFEVEVEIEATFSPPCPEVGIFGPCLDDLDLSSVSMLVREQAPFAPVKWRSVDLLDGLDKAAREQVIKNILAAYGNEIEESAYEDA